jgi:predicted TIM-barrel fold metal-dependent hydrolase
VHDKLSQRGLKRKKPSEYVKSNLLITTSGMFDDAPVICAIKAIGVQSVVFSVDYPYEDDAAASKWLAALPLPRSYLIMQLCAFHSRFLPGVPSHI